jgi:hypothetical protein
LSVFTRLSKFLNANQTAAMPCAGTNAVRQMLRQATTTAVLLDAGKAARFSVSAAQLAVFDRLLSHTERDLRCLWRPKGRS